MRRENFIKTLFISLTYIPFLSFKSKSDDCYTDSDVEGPFFKPGSPVRLNLASGYKKEGKKLLVNGAVFGNDCKTPLKNVLIEIWHASPEGNYDLTSDKYMFRGKIYTDENGRYSFQTLIPKGYKDGGLDRPRHIHYMVKAPNHNTLITQLYFQGDDKLKNDPFVLRNNGLKRAKPILRTISGESQIEFNIYLN